MSGGTATPSKSISSKIYSVTAFITNCCACNFSSFSCSSIHHMSCISMHHMSCIGIHHNVLFKSIVVLQHPSHVVLTHPSHVVLISITQKSVKQWLFISILASVNFFIAMVAFHAIWSITCHDIHIILQISSTS